MKYKLIVLRNEELSYFGMQITDVDTAKQYKHAISKLEENRKCI